MKKRRMRTGCVLRLLTAAAAGMLFLGIAGCGMRKRNERTEMLSYLKDKYGEPFDFVESYAGEAGKSYSMLLASSRKHPERKVLVRKSVEGGRLRFQDNYLAWILRQELEKKERETAERCFGECKVYYRIPQFVFPPEFGAGMSVDAFLKNPLSMAQFYIYPASASGSEKQWEQKLDEFVRQNAECGYKVRGTVSLPGSGSDYERITQENFASSDYEGYEAVAELVFSMDERGGLRYRRWMKGMAREKGACG